MPPSVNVNEAARDDNSHSRDNADDLPCEAWFSTRSILLVRPIRAPEMMEAK